MKNQVTLRGFSYIDAKDFYKEPYSIQKSSLASKNCIWVGCDNPVVASTGEYLNRRMHLTRSQARQVAQILEYFAETGELPELHRGKIKLPYAGAGVEEFEKEDDWGV